MSQSAVDLVKRYNADREPERLALKLTAMRANAFGFLRGTCHLFHDRMAKHKLSPSGPSAWVCGDLHLENFGTYLGENGLTYFDINDFDEAICAPHAWDILRLATSVLVAAPIVGLKPSVAKALVARLVDTYYAELAIGKPRWIERRTAQGPIGELIENLKRRDDVKFLNKRTQTKGNKRSLTIDGVKTLALKNSEREKLGTFLEKLAKHTANPKEFTLIDAARRIAGTGSLGIPRFLLLVEGVSSPDGNWMLDLKAAMPSAVVPFASKQRDWPSEADRVVAIQTLFQANTPSMLSAQIYRGASFMLKEMQPSADRLDLAAVAASKTAFETVIETMARLTAWGHLRGSGRYGSATSDDLIKAASDKKTPGKICQSAETLATINNDDWAQYCTAYDRGDLKAA